MADDQSRDPAHLISRALDADAQALRRVEDAGLGADLEHLAGIEARLRELHEPGEAPPLPTPAPERKPISRRAAGIAIIAACAGGALWYSNSQTPALDRIDGAQAYRNFLINDQPDIVCDTPEKFRAYTEQRFGESIVANFDTTAQLIGWRSARGSYDPGAVGVPTMLLARDPNHEGVIVIFQPKSEPTPSIDADDTLHRHKKTFGGLEAWEISRSSAPIILPLLSSVDK